MSSYLLFCTSTYLLQCLVYHMLSKMKSSGIYIPGIGYVIVEVSVLGLLVVVCKISKQGVAMSKRRFGLGDLDCRTT